MPEIIIVKNEAEAGEIYARCVADLIKSKPNAVLGLATGSSPLAAYRALAKVIDAEDIDVSQVQGFALDEYLGLPLDHPESYHSTINRTVTAPAGPRPGQGACARPRRCRCTRTPRSSWMRRRPVG